MHLFLGSNVTAHTNRDQYHSTIPSGGFVLQAEFNGELYASYIGYNANEESFRNAFQYNKEEFFNIEVYRSGSAYSGFSWVVVFHNPRGGVPKMQINASSIIGDEVIASVRKVQNGTEKDFWFDAIPPWMTEVPLSYATQSNIVSNVEVYVKSDGEVMKATCDGSNFVSDATYAYLQGNETVCGFHYASSATPLISDYRLFEIDSERTGIEIIGNYLGNNSLLTNVTIADHPCNISLINVTYIACVVSSVPWGSHAPQVYLDGKGYALNIATHLLRFKQSIYEIYPVKGSLAGGQIVHILGRGFRSTAQVTLGTANRNCDVLYVTSSEIICRTPPIVSFTSAAPSYYPTEAPTALAPIAPSESPTPSPTEFINSPTDESIWTLEPTLEPTEALTEEQIVNTTVNGTRKLQEEENLYVIYVDSMSSSSSNPIQFQYDFSYTPLVDMVTPEVVSSARSYNITIMGNNLFDANVSVVIGDDTCKYAKALDDYTITCVLQRSSSFGAAKMVDVKAYVPGKGYAAMVTDLISLPAIERGFEIINIAPHFGSLMGGNTLLLEGFGFGDDITLNQTITLEQKDWPGYTEYDLLLMALGFSPQTQLAKQVYLNCAVIETSFYEIVCELPSHSDLYTEAAYNISMTLNNIKTVCTSDTNCTYSQLDNYTPKLFADDLSIVSMTSEGAYTVSLSGEHLSLGQIHVSVSGYECEVLNSTDTYLIFQTPAIPTGLHFVEVEVDSLGYAYSEAYFNASAGISEVVFEITNGSLAGGPMALIHGYGFSPNCAENVFYFAIEYDGDQTAIQTASTLFYCTENEILLEMPSILTAIPSTSALQTRSTYNAVVKSVAFDLVDPSRGATLNVSNEFSFTIPTLTLPSAPFTYALKSTPLAILNATQGFAGDMLRVIVESPFSIDNSSLSVTVGGKDCQYLQFIDVSDYMTKNSQKFYVGADCVIPKLPARNESYDVLVWVSPYGYALSNASSSVMLPKFKSLFSADNLPVKITSSVKGQRSLTVTGKGFSNDTFVTICGVNATTAIANYDSLIVTIPERVTAKSVAYWQEIDLEVDSISKLSGTYFASSTSSLSNVYDDNYNTYFTHNSLNCYVGLTLASGLVAQPYHMRFYPRLQYAYMINRLVFEGKKYGSSSYSTIAITEGANQGWNVVSAGNHSTTWYTAFRYRALDGSGAYSKCQLAEVDFYGTVAYYNSTCNIKVKSPELSSTTIVGKVSYEHLAYTPIVRSVSPNNGSALGGTVVTITGENFMPKTDATDSSVSVTFSNIACEVLSFDNNTITCITGPRNPEDVVESKIVVTVGGKGASVADDNVEFQYIDNWSALTSWKNQEQPIDGDAVWVPDGQVILLDEPTPNLAFLLIEGSLILDRSKDLSIDSNFIFILGGYFEVGTADEPFEKNVVITIHGDRYTSIELPFIGTKFIGVSEKGLPFRRFTKGDHLPSRYMGQLEVHGAKRLRTWTKVNETCYAGSNFLITSEPVDFKPGDRVIVTGSEMTGLTGYDDMIVLETIDNHNVTFTTALKYTHRSEVVTIEGRVIDLRVEIGLLTRNVVIQGDNEMSDGQIFGVHTIAMLSGIYHMENAEIRRCGQAFNFGRYCTHSHMAGDMEGSYVKANSVHHSYQRTTTTHDTDNWEVRDNVTFDIQGHAFFVEDGSEKLNYITGNLGVKIRRSSALLKSDLKPAAFWTATPYNYWRDNVGCHSAMLGFWFEPVGTEENLCPVHFDVGEFRNNSLHSNDAIGIRIYPNWTPLKNPCGTDYKPKPQYLYNLVSWRNGGNGLFSKIHGDIHHISPTFVENGGTDVSIVHYKMVEYTQDPAIYDALFIGSLRDNFKETDSSGTRAIHLPQDDYFYVKNTTFVNYGTSGAITNCNSCFEGSEFNQGGNTYRFENIRFVNTKKRIVWSPPTKDIFWDLDGTFGGVNDSMITFDYEYLHQPECEVLDVDVFDTSVRCGGNGSDVRLRRMELDDVTPNQLHYTDIVVFSEYGNSEIYFLPLDSYGWVFPLLTGKNKTYWFKWQDAGISAYTFTYILGREPYLRETMGMGKRYDETVLMRYQPQLWDYDPYTFVVKYNDSAKWSPLNNTRTLYKIGDSEYKNRTIDVVVTNVGAIEHADPMFGVMVESRLCPRKGCPLPPQPSLSTPMRWSKASSWSSKTVPKAGQKVVIESNRWIVLDVNTPKLASITVYGKLSFLCNDTHPLNLTLTAQSISVFGIFEILGNDNSTYNGNATVVIYGNKGQVLPVTMAEGKYLGSKVIAVAGSVAAMGRAKSHSWLRLGGTVYAGSKYVTLSEQVDWSVGDEIILSPTAYFKSTGYDWSSSRGSGSADEIRVIKNITHYLDLSDDGNRTYSILELTSAVNHTHICETRRGVTFCGAVGVLTRSVRFIAQDADNTRSTSYGFGGHLHVIDIVTTNAAESFYGSIQLDNVEFKNFGKINSDHYMITMQYTDYDHPRSVISNCSFNAGFNTAFRAAYSYNVSYVHNVATGIMGGGVYIEATNKEFEVIDNMMVGTRQLASVLKSGYPWVRPIAGFTVFSPYGTLKNNLAAGSVDQGFAVAVGMFHVPSAYRSVCKVTHSESYSYSVLGSYTNSKVDNNEAVACRTGFSMVTMSWQESKSSDCLVLKGVKAWRSAHSGILLLDGLIDTVITEAVLVENYIGVNLLFYGGGETALAAVVNSTIMASLGNEGHCSDLSDTKYIRDQQCSAFTEQDAFGLSPTCGSVFSSLYRRVGIAIPQWTNKERTCTLAGRFKVCDPPNTPDRLCMLPWENRFGLPVDMLYAELHVHDTSFIGFRSREYNSSDTLVGDCIPSQYVDRSVAIAQNPTQYDFQPVLVTSGLSFPETDMAARVGMDIGPWTAKCQFRPCSGQGQLVFNDLDGTLNDQEVPAQLFHNNPAFTAPSPTCYEASNMSLGLYLCPQNNDDDKLTQYYATWRDWGPQVIHPIVTTRRFEDFNRSYATYGPIDDMCAKRFYFSRFNILLAPGYVHRVLSTGTIPDEFMIRWDAPSQSDVTVIEFFVQHGLNINVYVSDNPNSNFIHVPKGDRYPNMTDAAGTNIRDPQNRYLAVTLRGGTRRYYKFVKIPVVPVTIRMDMTMSEFFSDTFVANIAMLLRIPASRIKVTQVRQGSVIADFEISPSTTEANSTSAVVSQITELQSITANITAAIVSGDITTALNVTVLEVYAEPPVVPVTLDETFDADNATDFNITSYRSSLIEASVSSVEVLFTYPTSLPSTQPSSYPSSQPSGYPTASPTGQPTSIPTMVPSSQPTRRPTGQPTSMPTALPSAIPSAQPSSQPTNPTSSPSAQPSSSPTRVPTSQPSSLPTARPTGQPSREPTAQPSKQPFSKPTSEPTAQPISDPTGYPTTIPSSRPSAQPIVSPTSVPSIIPSSKPSAQPICKPTSAPSSVPSGSPTSEPSSRPSAAPSPKPTPAPTFTPTFTPTAAPSYPPTFIPTAIPTELPTASPTHSPTIAPTAAPSFSPSAAPTATPSIAPTATPTHSPTFVPTATPTEIPTAAPTATPTFSPTATPTDFPTNAPSYSPTTAPTASPTYLPTAAPTATPTISPTPAPSHLPTFVPTATPTEVPTAAPTHSPTTAPTATPTEIPTAAPTASPTTATPSYSPTNSPTATPTEVPTAIPTHAPTIAPTASPTISPTAAPSHEPTLAPTGSPTQLPTLSPTATPTDIPTAAPSVSPTLAPTASPTINPTAAPSATPTIAPTATPTQVPTNAPTSSPTYGPTAAPSQFPTLIPTATPTEAPTAIPSAAPTLLPTPGPTLAPSNIPTAQPSTASPSTEPTLIPTDVPTYSPSQVPSFAPTLSPTLLPTDIPTVVPSEIPSVAPSTAPTAAPTISPTAAPTTTPSMAPTFAPTLTPTEIPSIAPTYTVTSSPTSATLTAVSFTTSQTFSGITADEFKSNKTARAGLEAVIAATVSLDEAGTPNVTVTGVVDVARRERNRNLLSLTSGSAKVTYVVVYTYDSAVTVSAETIRTTFITQLTAAIDDGSFVSSLQTVASSVFTGSISTSASDLDVGEVTVIVVERPLPTQSPTTAPKNDGNDPPISAIGLAGAIAGGIIFFVVCGFCVSQFWKYRSAVIAKKKHTVKIVPVDDEKYVEAVNLRRNSQEIAL